MNKLAVDILLLPPLDITEQILGMVSHFPDLPHKLNALDCLPHMTLAMGVLDGRKLQSAQTILNTVAEQHRAVKISLLHTRQYTTPDNKRFSSLDAEQTETLTALHRAVMDAFRGLIAPDEVYTNMFVSPPPVAPVSATWVQAYYDKSRPEDFHPHITLGEGEAAPLNKPITYVANRLVLAHLGTYCTCRTILAEAILGN